MNLLSHGMHLLFLRQLGVMPKFNQHGVYMGSGRSTLLYCQITDTGYGGGWHKWVTIDGKEKCEYCGFVQEKTVE